MMIKRHVLMVVAALIAIAIGNMFAMEKTYRPKGQIIPLPIKQQCDPEKENCIGAYQRTANMQMAKKPTLWQSISNWWNKPRKDYVKECTTYHKVNAQHLQGLYDFIQTKGLKYIDKEEVDIIANFNANMPIRGIPEYGSWPPVSVKQRVEKQLVDLDNDRANLKKYAETLKSFIQEESKAAQITKKYARQKERSFARTPYNPYE